jgi:hypothetical protein
MKKYLLIIMVLASLVLNAQNVSMKELLDFQGKEMGEVEEALTSKGWKYIGGQVGNAESRKYIAFSFGDLKLDLKNKQNEYSVIYYGFSNNNQSKRISIELSSLDKYSQYLDEIKTSGYKLLNSDVGENGTLRKIYQGDSTTIVVKITTKKGELNVTLYNIIVCSTDDFNANFKNENSK